MEQSMLSFVLAHLPDEWEEQAMYSKSFILFNLPESSHEYQKVKSYFHGIKKVSRIQRVQNPFQYGRYMLRREMLQTNYEDVVFHAVHNDDINTALKFNCDYRRYFRRREGPYEQGQQPLFFHSVMDLSNAFVHYTTDISILVLKILTNIPKTQCDYYIQYVVNCN